jgi:alpha-L-arabinofuranosidase
LTGVFVNGTGVITPGNLPATSGSAVTVSPTATTTYTLTVTPSSGAAITQTATIIVNPAPTITSFVANPATITAGGSSSLTAVFANGTGMIEPGDLAVTSGTAVSVSPAATTIYTLTVTPPAVGTAITQTATVTVNPAPAITSFVANPATITAGGSASLTAVFANGPGVITPGNIAVTSGTPVNVNPTTTTTYTLTVTPPAGGTAPTQTTTVTVVAAATITSFVASPTTVGRGGSASLTGIFANGTGVITPGNITVTSGTAVNVSPTATTTYTLTVTNSAGTAVTQTATVTFSATAPAITSFVATPAKIGAGASSSLLADFVNGTGMITPGNLAVTSGTAVNVSPAATTTYTLTVTPTSGTAVTQTVTVTVVPPPTITSFAASPATIASGTSSSLTAVFANGTGVITPGNLTVTSGTPVSVSPTTTTVYTLTVTPSLGTAVTQTTTVFIQSSVSVNESSTGPAISDQLMGMNMAVWYDFTNSGSYTASSSPILSAFQNAGIVALRWPGGSTSDVYHWNGASASNPANGVAPTPSTCDSAYQDSNTNYLKFINDLEFPNPALPNLPNGFDVALTADYGTDPTCTVGGDPSEAANWVQYAYANGGTVSHVTVGNEEYGSWETDNHTPKHNGATYAAAVAGTSGYYALIKAASQAHGGNTLVGVIVEPNYAPWDQDVLSGAPYDFVEYHYYPQNPGGENDTNLVHSAAQEFTTYINTIKKELATAGKPDKPIYVGEMGSVSSNPGKQSWSITQGLYAGQLLGEMMNDGVSRATWWIGFGNCNGTSGNNSSSLYGWQDFGAYNVFSDGPADGACPNGGPIGTMSPTARAYQLFSSVAVNGESVLTAGVTGDTTNVRAYAATNNGGTALVLFNLNENANAPVTITLSGLSTASTVSVETYDKAIYDMSNPATTNTWAPPVTMNLGAQSLPMTLSLAPWSMNVVIIQ